MFRRIRLETTAKEDDDDTNSEHSSLPSVKPERSGTVVSFLGDSNSHATSASRQKKDYLVTMSYIEIYNDVS